MECSIKPCTRRHVLGLWNFCGGRLYMKRVSPLAKTDNCREEDGCHLHIQCCPLPCLSSARSSDVGRVSPANRHLHLKRKADRPAPRLCDLVSSSLPAPSPTVLSSQIPSLFREPYILSGYRPVHQKWHCYLFSLFQRHNESLNVWTHLLAAVVLLQRWWAKIGATGYSFTAASLPLGLFFVSSLTYLFFSAAAHLFQSRSEHAHYFLFFMDYVGVAVYQYGCSLGHYFYVSEPAWRDSCFGSLFLPGAAFLGWLSCASSCFAKSRYRRPYPVGRKICQLIPATLAYLLDISPVVHRLSTASWLEEPSLPFHALQIASLLLSVVFFSCPVPERFFPGRCDFLGQGHQIFHLFLSLCTLFQLEALFWDYVGRRDTLVETFGESQLWCACISFPALFLFCILTALVTMRHKQKQLRGEKRREN